MKNKKALLCKAFLNYMAVALSFAVFRDHLGLACGVLPLKKR